jgi:hypothetical protein
MKRSVAISKLTNRFEGYFMHSNVKGTMNTILDFIENELKMLPPTTIGEIPTATVSDIDRENGSINLVVGQTFGSINKWDPE